MKLIYSASIACTKAASAAGAPNSAGDRRQRQQRPDGGDLAVVVRARFSGTAAGRWRCDSRMPAKGSAQGQPIAAPSSAGAACAGSGTIRKAMPQDKANAVECSMARAAFPLSLSPCGRGWRARSGAEREPVEGELREVIVAIVPLTRSSPSQSSLRRLHTLCLRWLGPPSPTRAEGRANAPRPSCRRRGRRPAAARAATPPGAARPPSPS